MGKFLYCRILINNTNDFHLVLTCFAVNKLMYKCWKGKIRWQDCRKSYAGISKPKPILDLIYSLKTDGSASELNKLADIVSNIHNMDGIYNASII